jgi:DNA-binding IclR family transcriptional regulator
MTIGEAARFFALDCATCERVMAELLRAGSVTRGADQRYRLAIV